jgi:hypothetical protein
MIKHKVEKGKGSIPTGVQIYKMSTELFEHIRKKISDKLTSYIQVIRRYTYISCRQLLSSFSLFQEAEINMVGFLRVKAIVKASWMGNMVTESIVSLKCAGKIINCEGRADKDM